MIALLPAAVVCLVPVGLPGWGRVWKGRVWKICLEGAELIYLWSLAYGVGVGGGPWGARDSWPRRGKGLGRALQTKDEVPLVGGKERRAKGRP